MRQIAIAVNLCGLLLVGAVDSATADPVLANGIYVLGNHPDGGAQPPLYGLRLDGLGSGGVYTFDFSDDVADNDDDGAGMLMNLMVDTSDPTNSSIRIHGTVFGGLNSGSGYGTDGVGLWDVDFTYGLTDGSGIQVAGDGRIFVQPENNTQNNGTITPLFTDTLFTSGTPIALVDFINPPSGTVFNLNTGHRGFAGVSGWGWLTHGSDPNNHISASDWLFTVDPTPIPAPGAAFLAAFGMAAVGMVKRRFT